MERPAIFLDRDGTLIEEVNYLSRVEDLRIFPFSSDALQRLKNSGFLAIVVTNQSGIGRDVYDEAAMHRIHDEIQNELSGSIDAFYFCPHLPCDGCRCRKPGVGMIEAARADFEIDMDRSWMIGDKTIDIETGHNAGIRSAMVMTGYGQTHVNKLEMPADLVGETLIEVVEKICTTSGFG
jgi:D-glycero-D-manno-heptose 1,7-bisphosphate phosphatase